MARYKLILAYDGTDLAGSQRQTSSRTVQGELEKALHSLGWAGESLILAGRTDAGVHANGQVAAFDHEWPHPPADLQNALNSALPVDIAVRLIQEVQDGFHPRYDAHSRRYAYHVFFAPFRSPLMERYAWRLWPELDGSTLIEMAEIFKGTHDFSAFGSASKPNGSTERTIIESCWRPHEYFSAGSTLTGWYYEVEADGFLYRMVRRMVFIQVAAVRQKVSLENIRESLGSGLKLPAGLAPAQGLTLVDVTY